MCYSSRRKDDEMKIAEVRVNGCRCEVTYLEPIPKGIVGAVVSIAYTDPAWDNLRKTVVFRGTVTKDVLAPGSEVTIPAEVVSSAGVPLCMGVYGVDAEGTVVMPTIWAELGTVQSAAAPSGDGSTSPSLPVWAQIQAMIGDLDELSTTQPNLVAAINEALLSGGTLSPGVIQKIVEDYLKANPPAPGKDGKDGKDGVDGITPNIQIGTVTTLPAGSDATASMGGTAENPLLNLGIPKGADGQGGGSGGNVGFPKFELLLSHAITEEEIAAAPARFAYGTSVIPNLNDFNVFTVTIYSPDGSTITFSKWVKLVLNNVSLGSICGLPSSAGNCYTVSANRLYGVWVSTDLYNANDVVPVLLSPHTRMVHTSNITSETEITSIGFTSYSGDFGLVAGTIVEIWGAK